MSFFNFRPCIFSTRSFFNLHLISQTEKKIVFFRNTFSRSRNIIRGGPHGSISRVFLFSLFVNDMPEVIENRSIIKSDDTKIIGKWFDFSSVQTDLHNVIPGQQKTELTPN